MKKLIIPKTVVTSGRKNKVLHNYGVEFIDDEIIRIEAVEKFELSQYEGKIFRFPDYVLIPGFIQTHVHLCQTLFRGLADDMELLDWLKKKIFPYENAHNPASLRASARLGIAELQKNGTTTILDMGTLKHQEVIFEELISGMMRAFSGKCMIDENNIFPSFKETTEESIASSCNLAKEFHGKENDLVKYAFAPRFVLSCTEKLLKETMELVKDFEGSIYHSHASENKKEIIEVKQKFGMDNIEYFESINVLSDRTVLAHCIHTTPKEIELLKETQTAVAHCPSANLKLGSGIADIPHYLDKGIKVSLGADGPPCNNNLSIFTEMRLAALIQKPVHGPAAMDAETIFKLATIDGAKALNLEKMIGSIEVGKKADLVLLDLNKVSNSLSDDDRTIFSDIVYASNSANVKEVIIGGEWVVGKGESLKFDENKLFYEGSEELKKLIKRTE